MIALLFIYLSVSLSLTTGKPLKASNRTTGGYTPVSQQSLRTITVGRNAMHAFNAFNDFNNNNFNHFNNISKVNAKTEMNSDSHSDSESTESIPKYYASPNAAYRRQIHSLLDLPTNSKPKLSSSVSSTISSKDNMYYYSPETYGKANKKPKTGLFAYPSSTTTASITTSTSTTPTPKTLNNRFGEVLSTEAKRYDKPAPQAVTTSYDSNQKHSMNYKYESSVEEIPEDNSDYDTGNKINQKYFYPIRNTYPTKYSYDSGANRQYFNSIANEGTDSNQYFNPTDGRIGANNPVSNNGNDLSELSPTSGNNPVMTKTWLGPGIAGLIIGILPLCIIIASVIPAFVSVPVISTSVAGRRKRHILGFNTTNNFPTHELFEVIAKYEMSSLEDSDCLKEMFCSFIVDGRENSSNLAQDIILGVIDWTPDQWAKSVGFDTLFNAIKKNKCQNTYRCKSHRDKHR